MSSNLKVNSLVPATGTEIGIGTTGGSIDFRCPATFGGNVTIGGTLTYDEVINIDSIGIITARTGLNVSSGTATFAGAIDANGDLDVDGHTELDNVNIAGIVTVSNTAPGVHFIDTNANSDFMAQVDTGVFKIVDLTNSSATRVVINSAGKLGINEVNPTEMLHIKAEDNTDSFGGIIVYANNNSVYTKHGWRGLDTNEALRFAISGTEKMRLTNGGKLALGRSSADEMIHITHDDNSDHYGGIKINANNGSVYVKYGWRGIDGSETLRFAIGGTEKLRLDSNGKFLYGIGTARSGFFNTASQFNPHFQIEGAGDADDPGRITSIIYNSTTTAGPTLLFGKTNTGSVGGTGAVANNHGLGLITFQGMVGGQFTQGATIGASVSGSPGDNDLPTHLSFGTCADGAASASERLRIDRDGRLIQRYSAAPYDNRAATFQSPAGQGQTYIAIVNTETNGSSGILFGDHAGQNAGNYDGYINYSHQYQMLQFMVNAGNERLRIASQGQLGIGGANYGSSGQVLTSQGSSSAPVWANAGITMADQWRITSSSTLPGSVSILNSNWGRVASPSGYGNLGSAMSESSGAFTFPATGIYFIEFTILISMTQSARYVGNRIQTTTDNFSSANTVAETLGHMALTNSFGAYHTSTSSLIFDVTNTSTHKIRFCGVSINPSASSVIGNANQNSTFVTFIRLGDT